MKLYDVPGIILSVLQFCFVFIITEIPRGSLTLSSFVKETETKRLRNLSKATKLVNGEAIM